MKQTNNPTDRPANPLFVPDAMNHDAVKINAALVKNFSGRTPAPPALLDATRELAVRVIALLPAKVLEHMRTSSKAYGINRYEIHTETAYKEGPVEQGQQRASISFPALLVAGDLPKRVLNCPVGYYCRPSSNNNKEESIPDRGQCMRFIEDIARNDFARIVEEVKDEIATIAAERRKAEEEAAEDLRNDAYAVDVAKLLLDQLGAESAS